MTAIRWSPQTVEDLESIRDFIERDSPFYARLTVQRLVAAVDRLAIFPLMGRVVSELDQPDLRELFMGSYRLVYRHSENLVEVVTVFHGSRLLPLDEV